MATWGWSGVVVRVSFITFAVWPLTHFNVEGAVSIPHVRGSEGNPCPPWTARPAQGRIGVRCSKRNRQVSPLLIHVAAQSSTWVAVRSR